jgi:hypothetical protein
MDYIVVASLQLGACMTFFLRVLEYFKQLGNILYVGHMDEVVFLKNFQHWRRSVWHSRGGL